MLLLCASGKEFLKIQTTFILRFTHLCVRINKLKHTSCSLLYVFHAVVLVAQPSVAYGAMFRVKIFELHGDKVRVM